MKNDIKYMKLALEKALLSVDPSTQNGAVIVNEETGEILGSGCNEFPKGVEISDERWERPLKYNFVEHAERNSIFDCVKNGKATKGMTMYCPWFACSDCARAIIQSGVLRVVGHKVDVTSDRWGSSIEVALQMLKEAGVQMDYVDHYYGITVRRNGELLEF